MSWRPAVVGAVAVIVAGFVVGLAVGAVDAARTRTVTVVRSGPTSTATTPHEEPEPVQHLADTADAQPDNLEIAERSSRVTIGRDGFDEGIAFTGLFAGIGCLDPATVEYPVESDTARFVGAFGWTPESDSSAAVVLDLRADRIDGERLFHARFDGPGKPVTARVQLRGAYKVVFVFSSPTDACAATNVTSQATFAFGTPRFVG